MTAVLESPPRIDAPAISVRGLEKSFGETAVLRGVDFEVATGEVFALLGSNGAGKTTLIRVLATLLAADAGEARVQDHRVDEHPDAVRSAISLTGQFAAVDEVLTGRENLVLVARLRHVPQPAAVADALLARFALADAGGQRAGEYSGGMRRRLDIAMSLVGDPRILFLDEPTTGLDPQSRTEVWRLVRELADGGTTVLLTTQYLDEAEHLADRLAILHEGRIVQQGTLAALQRLLPPREPVLVTPQPTLEDVFLAIVGAGAAAPGDPAPTERSAS